MITTPRLRLRAWRDSDVEPFAAMVADPIVMEFFPSTLDRDRAQASMARVRQHFDDHGFGFWAIEVPAVADFVGFCGLAHARFEAPFTPCVEIGWRLARAHWDHGYATEAARAALEYGFTRLGIDEIVSFAVEANTRSRRVMERIGMTHDPADDFDHPSLAVDSPLRHHVLYRATNAAR